MKVTIKISDVALAAKVLKFIEKEKVKEAASAKKGGDPSGGGGD